MVPAEPLLVESSSQPELDTDQRAHSSSALPIGAGRVILFAMPPQSSDPELTLRSRNIFASCVFVSSRSPKAPEPEVRGAP